MLDNIIDEDEALSHATGGALVASGDQGVAQLGQEFYNQLAARIGERIRDCGARVPVVTGSSRISRILISVLLE